MMPNIMTAQAWSFTLPATHAVCTKDPAMAAASASAAQADDPTKPLFRMQVLSDSIQELKRKGLLPWLEATAITPAKEDAHIGKGPLVDSDRARNQRM